MTLIAEHIEGNTRDRILEVAERLESKLVAKDIRTGNEVRVRQAQLRAFSSICLRISTPEISPAS